MQKTNKNNTMEKCALTFQDLCLPVSSDFFSQRAEDTNGISLPNPIDEHALPLPPDVCEGLQIKQVVEHLLPQWGHTKGAHTFLGKYTTNIPYLESMQIHLCSPSKPMTVTPEECNKYRSAVAKMFKDTTFFRKYNYMDFKAAEPLNQSEEFMGINALSQYATPVMHAFFPLYVIFMPLVAMFFDSICNASGCSKSCSGQEPFCFWGAYICGIYQKLSRHFIGKQIFRLNCSPSVTTALLCAWALYYMVQGYLHYTHILSFSQHLSQAVDFVQWTQRMLTCAIEEWQTLWADDASMRRISPQYYAFMENQVMVWRNMQDSLSIVPTDMRYTLGNARRVGPALVQLYRLYTSEQQYTALRTIPLWMEYSGSMREWAGLLKTGYLSAATFESINHSPIHSLSKKYGATDMDTTDTNTNITTTVPAPAPTLYMKDHAHPILDETTAVTNSADLDSHYLITGINASGKSTCMKSVLLNVIFTQMIGIGRYTSCTMVPYTHFHLYLNIPDTNEKDSLFQAEARRCRDIMEILETTRNASPPALHFCAFDELFTGTNPRDAENITYAYLQYIMTHYTHVRCWLTTHFHAVCSRLESGPNRALCVRMEGDTPGEFTYKMRPGISKVENATSVLHELEFPKEVCVNATAPAL